MGPFGWPSLGLFNQAMVAYERDPSVLPEPWLGPWRFKFALLRTKKRMQAATAAATASPAAPLPAIKKAMQKSRKTTAAAAPAPTMKTAVKKAKATKAKEATCSPCTTTTAMGTCK